MPNAAGQMFLSDYVAELQAMGFDGYSPADLESYINRGYFYVARKNAAVSLAGQGLHHHTYEAGEA